MSTKNQNRLNAPPALLQQLPGKYPNLSPIELKVSALLTFNLSSSAVAEITGRSVRTIEFTRNKIRKKMNLKPHDNSISHLIMLASS